MKKFLALTLAALMLFTGVAFSAPVENALSTVPEESVYFVLKLDDTQAFLKWIFSKENIDTFMPLILASKESNEILGAVEIMSAFAENTPLKSAALLAGIPGQMPVPFFQMAFTVSPESDPIVKKVSDGSANAVDVAKLFLGNDSPLAAFAETMIKVEKANNNILKIDNTLFMKASNGMIFVGLTEKDIESSLKAFEESDTRLFGKKARTFSTNDFAYLHVDPETAEALEELTDDDDKDKKDDDFDFDAKKFLDKPLNVEWGFEKTSAKFIVSVMTNLKEAYKKELADKVFRNEKVAKPVKGGYMNPAGVKTPLFAMGGYLDLSMVKEIGEEVKPLWDLVARNLRVRFGIAEDLSEKIFRGPFSLTVNDNVTLDTVKVPAVYASIKSEADPAEVFGILSKSQHFHKIQDGILQIDSSLSPIACLVENKGDALGIDFAELANISAKPTLKPSLENIMNREAVSAIWIDFEEIRSWILAAENGVMPIVEPLARIMGYGEVFDSVKDVLNAEFSVPSMSFTADSYEKVHIEFDLVEINPANGLFAKLVSMSKKFMPPVKSDETSDDTEEHGEMN